MKGKLEKNDETIEVAAEAWLRESPRSLRSSCSNLRKENQKLKVEFDQNDNELKVTKINSERLERLENTICHSATKILELEVMLEEKDGELKKSQEAEAVTQNKLNVAIETQILLEVELFGYKKKLSEVEVGQRKLEDQIMSLKNDVKEKADSAAKVAMKYRDQVHNTKAMLEEQENQSQILQDFYETEVRQVMEKNERLVLLVNMQQFEDGRSDGTEYLHIL